MVRRTLVALLATLAIITSYGATAWASSASRTVKFNSSTTLTGNVWIQTFADWGGCGNYATSVISNRVLKQVTNTTTAQPYGIGATAWGLSISGPSGSTYSKWTNTNRKGSYLSGNVCMSWNTVYLSMSVNGTGNYRGVIRTVAAQV